MRQSILTLLLGVSISVGIAPRASAQSELYKAFKVDLGGTLAFPTSEQAGAGLGIFIEPKYGASDVLDIGLRIESTFLGDGGISVAGVNVNLSSVTVSSIQLTGDYYLSTERVRPFIGAGLGMFRRGKFGLDFTEEIINVFNPNRTVNLGFSPRIGVNVGHVKIGAIYNATGEDISDYLSVFLGVQLGGGRVSSY